MKENMKMGGGFIPYGARVVQGALDGDNPIWGKRLATFFERQALLLRAKYGGGSAKPGVRGTSVKRSKLPPEDGLKVMEAYRTAALFPKASAEALVHNQKVRQDTAVKALSWASEAREEWKSVGISSGTRISILRLYGKAFEVEVQL